MQPSATFAGYDLQIGDDNEFDLDIRASAMETMASSYDAVYEMQGTATNNREYCGGGSNTCTYCGSCVATCPEVSTCHTCASPSVCPC